VEAGGATLLGIFSNAKKRMLQAVFPGLNRLDLRFIYKRSISGECSITELHQSIGIPRKIKGNFSISLQKSTISKILRIGEDLLLLR
jgi:hypothetical protein